MEVPLGTKAYKSFFFFWEKVKCTKFPQGVALGVGLL